MLSKAVFDFSRIIKKKSYKYIKYGKFLHICCRSKTHIEAIKKALKITSTGQAW